jgi:hypothetical protein
MNATLEGSALSPMDLSLPRSKGIVIGFWLVTALFCLQMGFAGYAQLSLPQVAEAFTRLGFPDYFAMSVLPHCPQLDRLSPMSVARSGGVSFRPDLPETHNPQARAWRNATKGRGSPITWGVPRAALLPLLVSLGITSMTNHVSDCPRARSPIQSLPSATY